jgi:hypothetical protein
MNIFEEAMKLRNERRTRAHPVALPLPGNSHFRIQPLMRQKRGEYLRGRLG